MGDFALIMANAGHDSIGKSLVKVDEKIKRTNWPTFSLELQTVLDHLCFDELIVERKAKPADAADATTPAGY